MVNINKWLDIGVGASAIVLLALLVTQFNLQALKDVLTPDGNEGIKIHGHFHAELVDANGNVKQVVDKDNLVVTTGFQGLSKLVWNANSGTSPSTYRYIALGTSSSSPAAGNTALGTEVSAGGYSRQLTSSPAYSSGVSTLTGSFTGFACTCVEVGVFDASTSGNMISRQTYSTITITSSDTLNVTYTFTVT